MADQEPNGPVMLPVQRQDRILAEIERAGGARITQLAEQLSVSEMTVRRDIDALARQGLIKKVYGGATAPARSTSDEPGFEVKSHRELAAKDQIGAVAASLIQPSTTVAVSAGTTTYASAVHLARIPGLTVVTNSVRVADYLHAHGDPSQTVLLTGGVRTPSDALVGPVAVQTINGLHVDALLLGVHGMDPAAGFTTPNLMEAEMNRAMIATTSRLIVLADHTKWGVVGLCAMARLADASVLVSDEGLSAEARDALSTAVGELILAGPGTGIGLPSPVRLRDVVVAGWALQFRHFEFQRAVMPGSRSIPCAMEPRGVRGASNIRLILLGCQVIK
jgi:DeoR/GlpR family transcriptional regulator of sugar metabolism